MQTQIQNYKDRSRCVTLESPKNLYDNFLLQINEKFGTKEKEIFEFWFRNDLPSSVLETHSLLKCFQTLEKREKLSWTDVNSVVDFLKYVSRGDLVSVARNYQARIGVIQFFQRHFREYLPELYSDDKFNEKLSSEQKLPKHYLKRCHELFRRDDRGESRNQIRRLFSEGVVLLVNSCSGPSSDLQSAYLKLLYLADLFYKRFKEMIVDDKELLDIKSLLNGKFLARDNRKRKSVTQRRRSSIPAEFQQQLSQRRGSREVIQHHLRLCISFVLGVFTTLLGIIRFGGGDNHLNENREDVLEGNLSD